MTLSHASLCQALVQAAQRMAADGHVLGTSGNVSLRVPGEEKFLITPSSLPYPDLTPEDIVLMDFQGEILSEGRPPSVESGMHLRILKEREDVKAIFHHHSPCATALAALRIPIPPFLEELVIYLGGPVQVAPYAGSGSDELAENVMKNLEGRAAVLMANHGSLCVGSSLEKAYHVVNLVERAARVYLLARTVGEPPVLPQEALETQVMIYDFKKTQDPEDE